MEFRKLISFGKTSYVMSLPKSWIVKNNLKKGDLIGLEEKSGSLVLSLNADSKEVRKQKEIVITTDQKDINVLKRETAAAYINNYNPIYVTGKDITQKAPEIRHALNNLIALEVMEQDSDRIVAKDFLNMNKISILHSLKKMDMITRSMFADTKTITSEEDYQSVYHRDEDVNRLSFLIYRGIKYAFKNPDVMKQHDFDHIKLMHYWFVTNNIENIADHAKRIARKIKGFKANSKDLKNILEIYSIVEKRYIDTLNAFYNQDLKKAHQIASSKKENLEKIGDFAKKNASKWDVAHTAHKMQQMLAEIHEVTRTIYLFLENNQK